MPRHINSAYRVHAILFAACEHNELNEKMWEVFAKVFRVQTNDGRKKIFEVNRLLDLFYDQVENTKRQLEANNFSPEIYQPVFKTIEERITPGLIFNDWPGYRREIEPTLNILKLCSEVLPNEEDLVSPDDLASLEELLEKLEAKLQKSDLPDEVRKFVRHHIGLIRKAIRDYQVIGIRAFRTAFYEGWADSIANEEIVIANEEKDEVGLLKKAWGYVVKVGDITIKAEKLLTAGNKLYEMGAAAIDHLHKHN